MLKLNLKRIKSLRFDLGDGRSVGLIFTTGAAGLYPHRVAIDMPDEVRVSRQSYDAASMPALERQPGPPPVPEYTPPPPPLLAARPGPPIRRRAKLQSEKS